MLRRHVGLATVAAAALAGFAYGCPRRQEPRRPTEVRDEPEPVAGEHEGPGGGSEEPGGGGATGTAPAAAPAGDYTVVEVANGGILTGVVRWTGPRPPMDALPVTKNPDICGPTAEFPALHIGEGDGVQFTVVYIDGITRGRAFPQVAADQAPVIDQNSCHYVPHVEAIGLGQQIGFRNSDGTLHNIHAFWSDTESWFNLAQPTRGMVSRKTAEHTGIARVVCDAGHTWMLGYIHVFPHPYYAVTDAAGHFRIEGVPPGTYTVKVWHEGWRVTGTSAGRPVYSAPVTLQQSVTVAAGQEATATFELSNGSAS